MNKPRLTRLSEQMGMAFYGSIWAIGYGFASQLGLFVAGIITMYFCFVLMKE